MAVLFGDVNVSVLRYFFFASLAMLLAACPEQPAGRGADGPPPPRSPAAVASPMTGPELYAMHCQSCHGDHGQGVPQIFPPLAGSERLRVPEHFVHGLIHGYPPTDTAQQWMGEMPQFGHLSDADLATLATYARQQWGGTTDVIPEEMVTAQRGVR